MKIVDVAEFYADGGGGVKTYINQKLTAGVRAGHEVVVIAPGPAAGVEERFGGRVLWVKSPPLPVDPRYYILWREKEVHRLLDEERPDVVEGSSAWTGGWFAARWRGTALRSFIFHQDPVAVYPQTFLGGLLGTERVDRLCYPFWAYLRAISRRYDLTVTSGSWLAERLARFGLKSPVAVPFGIDKSFFSPHKRSESRRAELLASCGQPASAALVLVVSRLHPEKRIGVLLDAFAAAARQRPMGLVLIGDGPLRRLVQRKARGIQGVHIAGFIKDRDEMSTILASGDVLFHGSAAETYGIAIAEALCSGLPIVVPSIGGAADLADPAYAEVYPPGDRAAATQALLRMLDRGRDSCLAHITQAAAVRVATIEQHFAGLFSLYSRLREQGVSAHD